MKEEIKNEASKKACEMIRKAFWEYIPKDATDDMVIEQCTDEWSWFMQGFKESHDLISSSYISKDKALGVLEKSFTIGFDSGTSFARGKNFLSQDKIDELKREYDL